jgi:hypothetical protein
MLVNAMQLFESWHVTDVLVGIPPTYLNMFLQRKLYGITASVSGRRGDKNSRRFDDVAVFGIALAWMLFKSGLRTEPIRRILADIADTKDASAEEAARMLLGAGMRYLVVIRELTNSDDETVDLKIKVTDWLEELPEILAENPTTSVLVLPVGEIFDGIEKRMAVIQGG